jgi:glycosyltransferase involved in cell wall biosynthesis
MPGGKEIHVAELSRAQAARGHDIVLRFRYGTASALPVHPQPSLEGIPLRGLLGTIAFALTAAWKEDGFAQFDVVHAHGDLAEAWAITRPILRRGRRAATVLTVHGQLNPRYRRLSRIAFRHIDAFIALGDAVRNDLIDCGVDERLITTMSSGLDTTLLDAHRDGARQHGLIVTVGSLDQVKNIRLQIDAVRSLPPEVAVRLEIIGSGKDADSLTAAAAGDPRIAFLGHMQRDSLYARVASAEIFVLSSQRLMGKGEGVSTALLEAMYLGCACIVSADAAPGTIVSDGTAYRSVPTHDVSHLAGTLRQLLDDETARRSMGRAAHAAVASLSWANRAKEVDSVYRQALDHRAVAR